MDIIRKDFINLLNSDASAEDNRKFIYRIISYLAQKEMKEYDEKQEEL